MTSSSMGELVRLSRLAAAMAHLTRVTPANCADVLGEFLDAFSEATHIPRDSVDGMDLVAVRRELDRLFLGGGYAEALDIAREAWASDLDD